MNTARKGERIYHGGKLVARWAKDVNIPAPFFNWSWFNPKTNEEFLAGPFHSDPRPAVNEASILTAFMRGDISAGEADELTERLKSPQPKNHATMEPVFQRDDYTVWEVTRAYGDTDSMFLGSSWFSPPERPVGPDPEGVGVAAHIVRSNTPPHMRELHYYLDYLIEKGNHHAGTT